LAVPSNAALSLNPIKAHSFINPKADHTINSKGKAIPLQALTGREVSRSLRLLDFKTINT
jgi:hypothetical protein